MTNYSHTAILFQEDIALLRHLTSSEKNVYFTLVILADVVTETQEERVREIYITQRTISDVLGLCNRTIHKAIAKMKSLSILSVEKRGWNVGQSSLYTLRVSKTLE